MKKASLLRALAAGGVLAGTLPAVASAAPPTAEDTINQCPPSFSIAHSRSRSSRGDLNVVGPSADANRDRRVCVKRLPNGKLLVIDNNIPGWAGAS